MSLQSPIRTLLVGAGPLGINIYNYALQRSDFIISHVYDIDPALTGRDMGLHAGMTATDVTITDTIEGIEGIDVAILATVSDMARIAPQVIALIDHGWPVVSTCEEMFFPLATAPGLSASIDAAARTKGVSVLATGVNPGFLMDALPAMLTGVCLHVDRVEVRRYQDAQYRRIPFQRKIGAGLSLEEFDLKKADGSLRHVGLTESMQFIAYQLGWSIERTEDKIEPVIAERFIETDAMTIPQGHAAGVRQVGRAWVDGEEKIRLSFQASVGEDDSYDEIEIFGVPHIRSRILGGVHGDIATCSIILNACHSVLRAVPGLHTMADVPMITSMGR